MTGPPPRARRRPAGRAAGAVWVVAALPLYTAALVALVVMLGGLGAAVLSGSGREPVASAGLAWSAAATMAALVAAATAAMTWGVALWCGQRDATPLRYGVTSGLLAMHLGGLLGLVGVVLGDMPGEAAVLALPIVVCGGVGTAVAGRDASRHGPVVRAACGCGLLWLVAAGAVVVG